MNNTPQKAALTKAYVFLKIRFSMAWYQRKTSSKDYGIMRYWYTDICPQTSDLNKPAIKLEKFEESQAKPFWGAPGTFPTLPCFRVITREISQLSLDQSMEYEGLFGRGFWAGFTYKDRIDCQSLAWNGMSLSRLLRIEFLHSLLHPKSWPTPFLTRKSHWLPPSVWKP